LNDRSFQGTAGGWNFGGESSFAYTSPFGEAHSLTVVGLPNVTSPIDIAKLFNVKMEQQLNYP